jgi:Na+/proline symporter
MNGLDQNIMQLNLSCRSLKDAQKNLFSLAFVMVAVNFVFLALGSLAREAYAIQGVALPAPDEILPKLALGGLGQGAALLFLLGLSAATFSSAGTILPAIASSVEIDLLPARLKDRIPVRLIHTFAAFVILALIFVIHRLETRSLIDLVLRCSGYTYGPLIGLYGLGIFSRIGLKPARVPLLCLLAIALTAVLDFNSSRWFGGYRLGVELIAVNAGFFLILTFLFGRDGAIDRKTPISYPESP